MKYGHFILIGIIFSVFLALPVSSSDNYNDCSIYGTCKTANTVTVVNINETGYSNISNYSNYAGDALLFRGLLPTAFADADWGYNQTAPAISYADSTFCALAGCEMNGNINLNGFNLTNVGSFGNLEADNVSVTYWLKSITAIVSEGGLAWGLAQVATNSQIVNDMWDTTGCSAENDWCYGADINQDGRVSGSDKSIINLGAQSVTIGDFSRNDAFLSGVYGIRSKLGRAGIKSMIFGVEILGNKSNTVYVGYNTTGFEINKTDITVNGTLRNAEDYCTRSGTCLSTVGDDLPDNATFNEVNATTVIAKDTYTYMREYEVNETGWWMIMNSMITPAPMSWGMDMMGEFTIDHYNEMQMGPGVPSASHHLAVSLQSDDYPTMVVLNGVLRSGVVQNVSFSAEAGLGLVYVYIPELNGCYTGSGFECAKFTVYSSGKYMMAPIEPTYMGTDFPGGTMTELRNGNDLIPPFLKSPSYNSYWINDQAATFWQKTVSFAEGKAQRHSNIFVDAGGSPLYNYGTLTSLGNGVYQTSSTFDLNQIQPGVLIRNNANSLTATVINVTSTTVTLTKEIGNTNSFSVMPALTRLSPYVNASYVSSNDISKDSYFDQLGNLRVGNDLDVNGNLTVHGNINVAGCIVYNGGTLGTCI